MNAKIIRIVIQITGLGITTIAALTLLGYVMGLHILRRWSEQSAEMALPTSICLLLCGLNFIAVGSESACFYKHEVKGKL
jgi:hypothetical protein